MVLQVCATCMCTLLLHYSLQQASLLIGELASQFSVIQHQVDDPFLVRCQEYSSTLVGYLVLGLARRQYI